eukprot:8620357-Alexandrium_andersonii.AAC.1
MSASLVGSEMCIRDSRLSAPLPDLAERRPWRARWPVSPPLSDSAYSDSARKMVPNPADKAIKALSESAYRIQRAS